VGGPVGRGRTGYKSRMDGTAALVIASVSALVTAGIVLWLFVWAARKDGEFDQAEQRRLGIRRKSRLGR
jgi:hypothetical protein